MRVKKKRSADTMLFMVGTANAVFLLPNLEPAQVIRRRRVRRSAKEAREPSDVADVVALRLLG